MVKEKMLKFAQKIGQRSQKKGAQALVQALVEKNFHFFLNYYICPLSTLNYIGIEPIEKKLCHFKVNSRLRGVESHQRNGVLDRHLSV